MQNARINHNALDAFGLKVWQPRAFRHPQLAADVTKIVAEPVRINARCAVVVFIAQDVESQLQAAEQKILTGMISVLNLSDTQYMLIKIYSQKPDFNLIAETINRWQANSVLQLDMQYDLLACSMPVVRTFGPQYLLQHPEHKAQAYKDLLTLRNILHHGTS